jgi:hypothetical protein
VKNPRLEDDIIKFAELGDHHYLTAYAILSLRDSLEDQADKLAHALYQLTQAIRPEQ